MIPDVGYMGYMYRLESQCLKITEKVAFNIIASENSTVRFDGKNPAFGI